MNPDLEYQIKIDELVEKLNNYTKLYDMGLPVITDREWDELYFNLQDLENHYGYYPENSPTQKIDYRVVNQLNKIEHTHLMLSLDKTKEISSIKQFVGEKGYICMGKMDGLTCSLTYRGGYLKRAETRGNGIVGEDILHNALVVKNIPMRIPYTDELTVDGEIICTYKDFEKFSQDYKNPRNFASGSIRLLDSAECAKRDLSFVAWDAFGPEFRDDFLSEKLYEIREYGFTIVPFYVSNNNPRNPAHRTVEYIIDEVKKMCEFNYYPIDGVVFKYDTTDEYKAAGRTDHHFKGGLAYKFYDEVAETTLLDIEWTMGRTGQLTPVAILEPIEMDGTIVSRASLHNISVMDELSDGFQRKGDKLGIYKANQIIPQVQYWNHEGEYSENNSLLLPETCPVCNEPTEIRQEVDSKILYCSNPHCEGKLVNRIDHFFGKKGLDAKGLSGATIEKLIEQEWVNSVGDIFCLEQYSTAWKNLPGFGEKSVSKLLQSIRDCRDCVLESVISAAGIPLIGRTGAKDIAGWFKTYSEFRQAIEDDYDFTQHAGYGYELNKALHDFDYTELDEIVEKYLNIAEKEPAKDVAATPKLTGLTFCVTGKVTQFKNRDELSEFITANGGKVTGSVSKNTNYLINNDVNSTSAKNKKAKELNIPIIDEQTLMLMFD